MQQVLATNGDTHLGGEDIDQRVMQYFLKMIKTKTGSDISSDKRALQKLRREVRLAILTTANGDMLATRLSPTISRVSLEVDVPCEPA